MKKRKICFVISSTIHYSRNFLVLEALKKRKDIELHIILSSLVISSKYTSSHFNVEEKLRKDGFRHIHHVHMNIDGDDHVAKAKTIGIGIIELSTIFELIKPHLLLVRGDRFELLSAAVAAASMNITIAHIEGGEVTGTIDESVRHAITKLAHYHFTTNEMAKGRVIRMGEKKGTVFNFGSPDVEVVKIIKERFGVRSSAAINLSRIGSGAEIDLTKDFLMVLYHPVTSESNYLSLYTKNLLKAIHNVGMQTIWFWPNFDAGAEIISHEIRAYREKEKQLKIRFLRYLPPDEFLFLLSTAKCLVGNSSAGVKECSYLGIPVVNIGSRQDGRLSTDNVVNSTGQTEDIIKKIVAQLKNGTYRPSKVYYQKNTSEKIAHFVAQCQLINQKKFED